MFRLAENSVSQVNRIKELEAKNRSFEEKLLDIERKFGDVRTGAEGLMSELQKSMDVAREGTSAMEDLVKRFDESQEKIKSLEAQNAALVAQILSASEKATIKARYDILMDYREGLLDETTIEDEIKEFEEDFPDEARRSSPVPAPTPMEAGPSDVEPTDQANFSESREARE